MGMYYNIEIKNDKLGYINFPESLSYFFEQLGGYGEKSIVAQIESILDIDLSIFQKTYHPEMESDGFWIDIEELINKLEEFESKIKLNQNYFSKVILKPIDDRRKQVKLDFENLAKYQTENPLSLYPIDNGIITEKSLMDSIIELITIIRELKAKGENQIRLVYS